MALSTISLKAPNDENYELLCFIKLFVKQLQEIIIMINIAKSIQQQLMFKPASTQITNLFSIVTLHM